MAEPATYGRMAGRYFDQCPTCRTGRVRGPDCAGSGPVLARIQRQTDKRQLRRYLDQTPEVYSWYRGLIISSFDPYDVYDSDDECVHGCVGGHGEPCRVPVCLISCHMFTVEAREGCRHGCNGSCERHGSDVCTFLCHPRWKEMFDHE